MRVVNEAKCVGLAVAIGVMSSAHGLAQSPQAPAEGIEPAHGLHCRRVDQSDPEQQDHTGNQDAHYAITHCAFS